MADYASAWKAAYASTGSTTAADAAANKATYGSSSGPNQQQTQQVWHSLGITPGGSNAGATGNPATAGGSSRSSGGGGSSVNLGAGRDGIASGTWSPNGGGTNSTFTPAGSTPSYAPSSGGGGGGNGFQQFNPASDGKAALGRTQYMYNAYQQAYQQTGDKSWLQKANDAASYGQQLRQQYGLGTTGGDYRGYYDVGKYGLQANPSSGMSEGESSMINGILQQNPQYAQALQAQQQAANAQQQLTPEQIAQMVQQNMQQFMNPASQINSQQMQQYAQQTADAQANAQKQALQNLLNQYQNQYNTSVSTIDNSTSQAKQALDNQYFQNYLAARDQMADRGLAGSGLANDQNTRLLLAKQQDLSGIYQDANTRLADAMGQWNNQADNTYQQMSQINPALTADQTYQQMYQQAMQNQLEANKTGASFLQNMFGYIAPDQNHVIQANTDMFKWNNASADAKLQAQTQAKQLGFDMYKFNNLSADQKAQIAQDLYKFNNLSADQKIQAQQKWADLGIMQQNANTSAYNAQTGRMNEQVNQQNADTRVSELQSMDSYRQASILQKANELKQTQGNEAASRLVQQANTYNTQLSQYLTTARSEMANGSVSQDTLNHINDLQTKISGLLGDSNGNTSSSPDMSGFPSSGSPSSSFANFLGAQ